VRFKELIKYMNIKELSKENNINVSVSINDLNEFALYIISDIEKA